MAHEDMDTTAAGEPVSTSSTTGLAGFEISPQQRRIWLFHRTVSTLHANITLEIQGALNVNALKRSIERVVAKHEILRTNFRRVPGIVVPVQVVHEVLPYKWHEVNLAGLGPEAQADRVRTFMDEESGAPFSYEQGSLLRVTLLRLEADRNLLSLSLPSLCADSASLRILVREIAAFYSGNEDADPGDPLQYADLSDWQNGLLED